MGRMDSGRGGRTDFKQVRRREQRKHVRRISLRRFPVVVYPLADTEEWRTNEVIAAGIVTDINRAGAGMMLDRPLRKGMAVMLILSPDGPDTQRIFASVVWSHELPTGRIIKAGSTELPRTGAFRVGFRFEGQDEEQNDFVERLLIDQLPLG